MKALHQNLNLVKTLAQNFLNINNLKILSRTKISLNPILHQIKQVYSESDHKCK